MDYSLGSFRDRLDTVYIIGSYSDGELTRCAVRNAMGRDVKIKGGNQRGDSPLLVELALHLLIGGCKIKYLKLCVEMNGMMSCEFLSTFPRASHRITSQV